MKRSKVSIGGFIMIIRKHFLIALFLLCFAFANGQSNASEKALFSLTPEEKAWLAEHPEISIGIMDAWAPMNFVDETGTPNGVGVDYLKELNQRLGGVLTIQAGPFKENYSRVKNKKLDALNRTQINYIGGTNEKKLLNNTFSHSFSLFIISFTIWKRN
jgi:ABC-type amino acid transport substrate-binding protein